MKTSLNIIPTVKSIIKRDNFVLYLYFNTDEFGYVDFSDFLKLNPSILHANKLKDNKIFSSVFVDNGLKWKKLPYKKTIQNIEINDYYSIGGDTIYKSSKAWYPNISELTIFIRQQNNLTQEQLAKKLKISVSKLSSIEKQKTSITMQVAKQLFSFF